MRVAIVDDNPIDRLNLCTLLEQIREVEIIGEADCRSSGHALIESQEPDVVFLDIRLGRETGFQLLESLKRKPRVIFTTLHQEYAFPAFEVEALDFLLKPISPERLNRCIQRMINSIAQIPPPALDLKDLLVFKQGRERRVIPVESVFAVVGSRDYTRVLASPRLDHLDQRRMRDWQMLLPREFFQMLDRSTIINLHQIATYRQTSEGGVVTLRNHPTLLPIGSAAFKRLDTILNS